MDPDSLPAEFHQELARLEDSYLDEDDPIRQSGFGGGAQRWRREREPILDAIDRSGDILDVGCANGYLLECLVEWGRERGLALNPHGLDQGPRLIELAKKRLRDHSANLHVGNGWDWKPPRRYRYVYTLYECVPPDYLGAYLRRLLIEVVELSGRLIVGAYGSRSRGMRPFDIGGFMSTHGLVVSGTAVGGEPAMAAFAWVDAGGRP